MIATKLKVGDRVLLLDSAFEQIPNPDTRAEAEQRLKPFTISDVLDIPIDDVEGAQSISFEEMPFNLSNMDVRKLDS